MKKVKAKFFKPQQAFFTDKSPVSAFIGGLGSGKTLTGVRWVLHKAITSPGTRWYACSNTYPQLKDVVYPKLFGEAMSWGLVQGVHYTFNKTDKDMVLGNGSIIMFRSLQNYNMIRGGEASGALLDEARDMEEEAFKVVLGRLRENPNAQLKITTTPAGYNWVYDLIQDGRCTVHKMATGENKLLPDSYVDMLKRAYRGEFLRQEFYAEFVNFAGKLAYYGFNRAVNLVEGVTVPDDVGIHVGMDFNVDPFCAVVSFIDGDRMVVFDEIKLRGSSLNNMIMEIRSRYGNRSVTVYPDSSGKNRTLIDMKSYIGELVSAFGGENVRYFKSNPRLSARYGATNAALLDRELVIDSRCESLIRDLERVKFDDSGAFSIDKKDKELTHMGDALGYKVWYISKNRGVKWQQR